MRSDDREQVADVERVALRQSVRQSVEGRGCRLCCCGRRRRL